MVSNSHGEQFLILPQCSQLFCNNCLISIFLTKCFQSHLLQICCRWERVTNRCTVKADAQINFNVLPLFNPILPEDAQIVVSIEPLD